MTVLRMYNKFLFIEKMQCGYKELLLLRTFSCGYLGLLYPDTTVLGTPLLDIQQILATLSPVDVLHLVLL